MGYQHGALLKREIRNGPLAFFQTIIDDLVAKSSLNRWPGFVSSIAKRYLRKRVIQPIVANLPDDCREELEGLAAGAQLELDPLLEAFITPDLTSYLVGKFYAKREVRAHDGAALGDSPAKEVPHRIDRDRDRNLGFAFGCTSLVATGAATSDGKLVHARNMDFMGINYWEPYQTVIYYHPEDKKRFVSVSAAGVPFACLSAMNEDGLCYALHQNYSNDIGLDGPPVLTLGALVIRNAATIPEALEVLRANPPNAGWTVGLSDSNATPPHPFAVAVELSANKMQVRECSDDTIVVANTYTTPTLQATEVVMNESLIANSHTRFHSMTELARAHYGEIDAALAAAFLGDHFDPHLHKTRSIGDMVVQLLNLQAVVLCPEDRLLYVANGRAPVCNSDYIPFHFDDDDPVWPAQRRLSRCRSATDSTRPTHEPTPLEGNPFRNDPRFAALAHITAALEPYRAHDLEGAYAGLKDAVACDPEEPIIHHLLGMVALQRERYNDALAHFQAALDYPQRPYKTALEHLWSARVYDLLGRRDAARKAYATAIRIAPHSKSMRSIAETGRRRAYKPKHLRSIDLEFWLGEELELS